jgi:bifunctional DNase/RNase
MLIAVEIASFGIQTEKNTPLIILRESAGERTFAAPISSQEASAIAIQSLNVRCEKPLMVDFIKSVIGALHGKIDKVVFYAPKGEIAARLHIVTNAKVIAVECGCGDAVAMAMRCHAPLFVEEGLFMKNENEDRLSDKEVLRRVVAAVATLEFGSYFLR